MTSQIEAWPVREFLDRTEMTDVSVGAAAGENNLPSLAEDQKRLGQAFAARFLQGRLWAPWTGMLGRVFNTHGIGLGGASLCW